MLGGAKRVSMARHFINAVNGAGLDARLYSYELDSLVPISTVARVIIGKRWNDPLIFEDLHNVIQEHDIDIIIPFVDGAVEIASRYSYGDCFSPVCTPLLAAMMFDKGIAAQLFEREHIPVPRTYSRGAPRYPLIAKPRMGSASRGIKIVNSSADFRSIDPSQYLIQEYIEKKREYTVDCYISQKGAIITIVPRERLETAGGEVTRTVTVDRPDIISRSKIIIDTLKLTGAITLQFLEDCTDGRVMLMEINPRLGGGAVTAIAAGADIPAMIIAEALGNPLTPATSWKPGTLVARYLQETVFNVNPNEK